MKNSTLIKEVEYSAADLVNKRMISTHEKAVRWISDHFKVGGPVYVVLHFPMQSGAQYGVAIKKD